MTTNQNGVTPTIQDLDLKGGLGFENLKGGDGNDTLDGGNDGTVKPAQADVLSGGKGDDTYIIRSVYDVVAEYKDEGTDTVKSYVDYTLGSTLEKLVLLYDPALKPGISRDSTGNVPKYSYALNGSGNDFDNELTGNALNNTLSGRGGNDLLKGEGGNDRLFGETGDDTLDGGEGNDMLNGGTGADRMEGGAGGDDYYVDDAGDVVVEVDDGRVGRDDVVESATGWTAHNAAMSAGAKTDRVFASITYTLTDNVEVLSLTGKLNLDGTGNGLNNAITGNAGNNKLAGLDGSDQIWGGAGNDTLEGGNGDDWLDGGYARDQMTGGEGNDAFVFGVNFPTPKGGGDVSWGTLNASSDKVTDFKAGEDYVALSRTAFAKLNTGSTLDSSAFTLGTKSSSADTRVIYDQTKGQLWYDADGSGTAFKQVLIATFDKVGDTHPVLSVSDFLLIA